MATISTTKQITHVPQVLQLDTAGRAALVTKYAAALDVPSLPSTRKDDISRAIYLMKLLPLDLFMDDEVIANHHKRLLHLVFEIYHFLLTMLIHLRDIENVLAETQISLKEYLESHIDSSHKSNLASLIGIRFLGLSKYQDQLIRSSSKRCFEFLFLHEIIFEKLITDDNIYQILKEKLPDINDQMDFNTTLIKIMMLQYKMNEKKIDHEKIKSFKIYPIYIKSNI